jgi:hypothetical protein
LGLKKLAIFSIHLSLLVLDERGVDMHKVEISRAELALWGIEHLTKFQKAKSRLVHDGKVAVKDSLNTKHRTLNGIGEDQADKKTGSKKPNQ